MAPAHIISTVLLVLASHSIAANEVPHSVATNLALVTEAVAQWPPAPPWPPATDPEATAVYLHREYSNVFRHGNRNAASHLWASFLLARAPQMTWERLLEMFSGFCAVSGSPVRPSDYQRYRLTLSDVASGEPRRGFMYYCCWPCVCDTHDFIKVDTLDITTSDGVQHKAHVVVIGNPCLRPEALRESFVQSFGRGTTTLERDAPEVRCQDGELIGATLSDHGHIVIQIFPLSRDTEPAAISTPTPGRIALDSGTGVKYQDESEFSKMCTDREEAGFNSGMGEIFRRVAQISPVSVGDSQAYRHSLLAKSPARDVEATADDTQCETLSAPH